MRGWIYIITNKAMPGLVKVGFSMKDPEIRARELGGTGLPHEYVVDYEVLVEEPQALEQAVHRRLGEHRERKEWFRCRVEEAIVAIKTEVGKNELIENYKRADREKAEAVQRQQESDARAKQEAEKKRREQEELLNERRREIIVRYEESLKKGPPQTGFWANFFAIFFTILFVVIIPLAVILEKKVWMSEPFFILLVISSFLITPFVTKYFQKKAQKSPRYLSLLAKRDAELKILENELLKFAEAANWYLKAAEKGNADAQYRLGTCYYFGIGVERSYGDAVKLFQKAAEQRNANAQNSLGNCYFFGLGVRQSYEEAAKWYQKAAEQGNDLS